MTTPPPLPQTLPDSREAFEAAAIRLLGTGVRFQLREDGLYDHGPTYDAFEIWNAALSQPPAVQQDRGEALTQHQIAVRLHDFHALSAFHSKHAMGALAAPSCLCCGKSTQGLEIGVKHLELPGIVICKSCKDRATSSEAAGDAETYLRGRYGAYRGHFAWRELEDAFNAGAAHGIGTPPSPTQGVDHG